MWVPGARASRASRSAARALPASLLALALWQGAALGATIAPTRTDDPTGPGSCPSNCSLRQAIEAAGPGGTVSLRPPAPSGPYTLTKGPLKLGSAVTIEGPAASTTAITGGGKSQLILVEPGVQASISGVTLEQGLATGSGSSGGSGGAIENLGALTLSGVNLEHDVSAGGTPTEETFGGGGGDGGAISNLGVLTIDGGEVRENAAQAGSSKFGKETTSFDGEPGSGGAIYSLGKLTIDGATLFSNDAEGGNSGKVFASSGGAGGAIYSDGATLVSGSSLSDNSTGSGEESGGEGGAIASFASLRVSQSTIDANLANASGSASAAGGGLYLSGTTQLALSTLHGDAANGSSSVGGAAASSGSLSISGSTITGDSAADGAALSSHTALSIAGSSITGNVAGERAGAIEAFGSLAVTGSTLSGNSAKEAGALFADGGATIAESTLDANAATGRGGAIVNDSSLTIGSSTVSGNSAEEAGAIVSAGATTIAGSTVSGNTAKEDGGAIVNSADLAISSSTLADNKSQAGSGGAIRSFSSASVLSSTLSGNSAVDGGAIESLASLEVTNSTIAANTATEQGGGLRVLGSTGLSNATIADNTASAGHGGDIDDIGFAVTIHDSIVALGRVTGGTGGENCAGPGRVYSLGYNLEDRNQCGLTGPGDLHEAAPLLGPLASNGGPTQTIALEPGSPAIDAGDPAGCTGPAGEPLTTDQRGVARPQGPRCDIGAYELVPPPVPAPAPASGAPVATPIVTPPTPAIKSLKVTPSSFRAASSGPTIASARKPATGARITYSDTLAASTTFAVLRGVPGVRSGKSCVAPPRRRKGHLKPKTCTRLLEVASFSHLDTAGANSLRFSGRVHGHKLSAGRYTLRATPSLAGRRGATASATFTIT